MSAGHSCGSITAWFVCHLRMDEDRVALNKKLEFWVLNTKNRMLCKWPSTALQTVRTCQQCSQHCSYGYVDLLALCPTWENTLSGERLIHLLHTERLNSLGLAIWQQVDCPLFWTPRVVPCTPPCCTHLNKWYNLFHQAGKLIVKLLQRRRSNQEGQRTVFTLIAAVAFFPPDTYSKL